MAFATLRWIPSGVMADLTITLLTDPGEFLAACGDHLAAAPVLSTVVATVAAKQLAADTAPTPGNWWLVVRDGTAVVGAGMCQPPPGRRMAYLLPMPDEAAPLAAEAVHAHEQTSGADPLAGINGALPSVRQFGARWAELTGGAVGTAMHTRLFELADLVQPPTVPGELRTPDESETALMIDWLEEFHHDAEVQGGRRPDPVPRATPEEIRSRVESQRLWVWAVDGVPVHLTGHNLPSYGVARVGPVFTPQQHRGHGYAASAVAEVSRRLRADGSRVCLFTDQANPVSNPLYERLGYRAVVDMENLRFDPA